MKTLEVRVALEAAEVHLEVAELLDLAVAFLEVQGFLVVTLKLTMKATWIKTFHRWLRELTPNKV